MQIFISALLLALPLHVRTNDTTDAFVRVDSVEVFTEAESSDLLGSRSVVVAAQWRNNTDTPVDADVTYTAYDKDGTPLGKCGAHSHFVQPGVLTKLFCHAASVEHGVRGARGVGRVQSVRIVHITPVPVTIVDSSITRTVADNGTINYSAHATMKVQTSGDKRVGIIAQMFDDKGVQLKDCMDIGLILQPEVAIKIQPMLCGQIPRKFGKVRHMVLTVFDAP